MVVFQWFGLVFFGCVVGLLWERGRRIELCFRRMNALWTNPYSAYCKCLLRLSLWQNSLGGAAKECGLIHNWLRSLLLFARLISYSSD